MEEIKEKTPKANKAIYCIFESASPRNLTDIKKLEAIAIPPRGTMFKLLSLF